MEAETKHAVVAASEMVALGAALFVAVHLALSAFVPWRFGFSSLEGLVLLILGAIFNKLGERWIVRPAEQVAEAEARELKPLAHHESPTWTGGLSCAIARLFVTAHRSDVVWIVLVGGALSLLVAGLAAKSAAILYSVAVIPALAIAVFFFMGIWLPAARYEEWGELRDALRPMKIQSLFRLRYEAYTFGFAIVLAIGVLIFFLRHL